MTLENIESRDGKEPISPVKLSFQGSNQLINQASFAKRETDSKRSASPTSLEPGNPLKAIVNDRTLQVTLMEPVSLNEAQTTSSFMKIKPPD